MKKIIILLTIFVLSLSFAHAEVNAVTPSTNDINRVNGWAHVDATPGVGEVTFDFVSTRGFYSCFEYRTDGDISQASGNNYNPLVTDGLYPFYCQNNNERTETIQANEYVEVRMVFGAEEDERFDWTRFDVSYPRSAEITSPSVGQVVSGMVSFDAVLDDKDGDDNVQWAVREGTCVAGIGTVYGNVDGYSDAYDWDGASFHAMADTSLWNDGDYCFIFNPTESAGDITIRKTLEFAVDNNFPLDKNDCKKNGWKTFTNPTFKNQGDCVSWVQSNPNAEGNRKDN